MDAETATSIYPGLDFSVTGSSQLLRFVPAVQVLMAGGSRDSREINVFYRYVDQFVNKWLKHWLTPMDARRFFAPFLQPSAQIENKRSIESLIRYLVQEYKIDWLDDQKMALYQCCVDIVAAATSCSSRRASGEKQAALVSLMRDLEYA